MTSRENVKMFKKCFSQEISMLVLYVWCLPKISHVMLTLRLLSFIFQNSLDSSVSTCGFSFSGLRIAV